MKKIILSAVLMLISYSIFAQTPAALPPPLETREVSGVVKDATGETLVGATVKLISAKDSLVTATNDDGIFIFKDVKLATFVITVKMIGQQTIVKKLKNSDVTKRIILDPISLKDEGTLLAGVTINGTPSIVYKTDTVQYTASDYKVRANATVDEMLKKAEGFEVGSDGSVTFQGQSVTKARLNGKDYAGGDVAQAIQSLPADIVDKFQVVDDYGDQAGRTGIKNGDATKVLNLTTRADKSVGTIVRASASAGSKGRHEERVGIQRLNGNQTLGINGTVSNTLNGIPTFDQNGAIRVNGSGGNTVSGNPSISYRDQWSKILQVNGSYSYNFTNGNTINSTEDLSLYKIKVENQPDKDVEVLSKTNSNTRNNSKTHRVSMEFEFTPDSSNFFRITPSFSYANSFSSTMQDQLQSGYINQTSNSTNSTKTSTPTYGLIAFYQYIFKKNHRRNISVQFNLTRGDQTQDRGQLNNVVQTTPTATTSLINRVIASSNLSNNYRASLTYVEPLGPSSQLEFNGASNYRGYDNSLLTDSINTAGVATRLDYATNIFNYSFLQTDLRLNYRLVKSKFNISIGADAIPTHLQGTNISRGNIGTSRNNFFLVPLFRFQYQWSRQQQLAINYNGVPSEPTFDQIQPVPDLSQSPNITYGNPDLKPAFRHTLSARYNNYIPNSRLNLSASVNASLNNNQIVSDTRIINTTNGAGRETRYVNMNGGKTLSGTYNFSKSFSDRRYSLMLDGRATYNYAVGLNSGTPIHSTTYNFYERFGPRINPNDIIEINPNIKYTLIRSFSTAGNAANSNITYFSANLEGRVYFGKDRSWAFEYDLSKNYVSGISSNVSANPFVANAYLEKQLFAKRNGILRISMYDIFNQNNFINRTLKQNGAAGWTDTRSSQFSRYIMVGFTINLQKWSGSVQRNGRPMQRRGDGSFIY